MTATKLIMLTGDSLIQFVNDYKVKLDRQERTRTDMIKDAGYLNDNGTAAYVLFYTELLNAKGIKPVSDSDVVAADYDEMDDDTKELYDHVDKLFGEKWTHEEVVEFINKLDDLDIRTKDTFDEYFYDRYDSEKEFAQQYYIDMGSIDEDSSLFYFIDWDGVARELGYDYDFIEFDWEVFVFRK
jgi:hypothetical protein